MLIRTRMRVQQHIELKAVAEMVSEKLENITLEISNNVPCGSQPDGVRTGCHQLLGLLLPEGYSLTIKGKAHSGEPFLHTYRGTELRAAVMAAHPDGIITDFTDREPLAGKYPVPQALGFDEIPLTIVEGLDELAPVLQVANRHYHQDQPEDGLVWFFTNDATDIRGLTVGVRGSVGALEWFEPLGRQIPSHGINLEWVDYFTFHGHHNQMPPNAELPIEQVLDAVAEYSRTRMKPTCIDWQADPTD